MADYFGKDIPKLGFGLMRLPRRGIAIDVEQTKEMVDMFMSAGFTYYDTAFLYPGSEAAIKKALVDRYPRESYTLTTKLNAAVAPTEGTAKKEFMTSLKRTGAGFFDYYLLHSLMANNYKKYERFRLWDYVRDLKSEGLIKHYGFSYHAGPELLDRILTEHPDAEFVQLQINYADWENPSVTSRANYEVARRHGKSIVIMEPVKGGALAKPPAEVRKLFDECRPGMSPASWAIRFAASLDGIMTVLSGMSNVAQMADNLSFMKDFRPLDEEERQVIRRAQAIMGKSETVPCTACRYCVEGCPRQIAIPDIFAAMNERLGDGLMEQALEDYNKAAPEGRRASDCISCRKCENTCPQHIAVTDMLRKGAGMFEN